MVQSPRSSRALQRLTSGDSANLFSALPASVRSYSLCDERILNRRAHCLRKERGGMGHHPRLRCGRMIRPNPKCCAGLREASSHPLGMPAMLAGIPWAHSDSDGDGRCLLLCARLEKGYHDVRTEFH